MAVVDLEDVIEALSLQADTHNHYLYREKGNIVLITEEELRAARRDKNINKFPDWQQENIKTAREIMTTNNYIQLPTKREIDEYKMVEKFCRAIEEPKLRNLMCKTIKGKGAFKRFKANIRQYDLEDDWYQYREREYRKLAIDWCKKNNIDYKE